MAHGVSTFDLGPFCTCLFFLLLIYCSIYRKCQQFCVRCALLLFCNHCRMLPAVHRENVWSVFSVSAFHFAVLFLALCGLCLYCFSVPLFCFLHFAVLLSVMSLHCLCLLDEALEFFVECLKMGRRKKVTDVNSETHRSLN